MKNVTSSAAVHAHADERQRIGPQEFHARALPVAAHLVGHLALEALQLRDIERRILRDDQRIRADVDAAQRRRRLLEIVAAVVDLGEHDLGIGIAGSQRARLLQPVLGIDEAIGKQRDPAEPEHGRIVVGMLGDDTGVLLARPRRTRRPGRAGRQMPSAMVSVRPAGPMRRRTRPRRARRQIADFIDRTLEWNGARGKSLARGHDRGSPVVFP